MKHANVNPKLLIVYYSLSGKTRRVARAIANASGADLEEIRHETGPAGALGSLRSRFEGLFDREPTIRPGEHDPQAYDVVIVGSPAWGTSVAGPVRTYLATSRNSLPEVAFFCTLGGKGADDVLAQLEELAGKRPIARLALPERYLVQNPSVCIGEFLEGLLSAWESRSRRAPANA